MATKKASEKKGNRKVKETEKVKTSGSPKKAESSDVSDPNVVLEVNTEADIPAKRELVVVGVGASAGGLEALRPFVAAIPKNTNMAYVIAQHMSPQHRSMMADLLARESQCPVMEVTSEITPEAGNVYVGPPNSDIFIKNGNLCLRKPLSDIGPKPSIDYLFTSLAEYFGERSVGVVLSGTGSDGSHGIRAINAVGGIAVAQKLESAKYDSMPRAAIKAGADLILIPAQIPGQLEAVVDRPRLPLSQIRKHEEVGHPLDVLIRLIYEHTKMDFSNYKEATLTRQIERRMAVLQVKDLPTYVKMVQKTPAELSTLANNFLVCVTSFFRDKDSFDAFEKCLANIIKKKMPGDDIRIWVPGCATGEEAYSIAIMLSELLGNDIHSYKVQVFATDVNAEATHFARKGLYPESSVEGMDPKILQKYFSSQDRFFQVERSLRDKVVFSTQDLIQDPPFVRVDAISCRNLLIYFKSGLQDKVFRIFHYALVPNGIMFLGKSESVGQNTHLFAEVDRKLKLFRKRDVVNSLPHGHTNSPPLTILPSRRAIDKATRAAANSPADAGRVSLMAAYVPPSFLITSDGTILEIFGDVGEFTNIKSGKADFNLFSIIIPSFRTELRAIAQKVVRSKSLGNTHPVKIGAKQDQKQFRAVIRPAGVSGHSVEDYLLVSFEEVQIRASISTIADTDDIGLLNEHEIADLENELTITRESLQTVIEELETSNEELQSLNEEAQAANEELQASNEELETSNEELQATNEELTTVNEELSVRTQELAEAINDMENIQNNSGVAMLVIDNDLNVRRYNKSCLEFFKIDPALHVQTLNSVPLQFEYDKFLEIVRKVVKGREAFMGEFSYDGKYFSLKVNPYQSGDPGFSGGAVITILDISDRFEQESIRRTQFEVAQVLAEAKDLKDAQAKFLPVICMNLGWKCGQLWRRENNKLVFDNAWVCQRTQKVASFVDSPRDLSFDIGKGIPGKVLASGQPLWVSDPSSFKGFDRKDYSIEGSVDNIFAVPLLANGVAWGVLELYNAQKEPNELQLKTLSAVCNQFCQYLVRSWAEIRLKENEKLLQNALAMAKAGHWEYDVESDLFQFNDTFYEMYRTTAEVAGGYSMNSQSYSVRFCHPDDRGVVSREIYKAIQSAEPDYKNTVEHRAIFGDGAVGYIFVRYYAVKNEKNKTVKLFGVNQDVTWQHAAMHHLEAAKKEAEMANVAKSKFLSSMSHELRTPLNAILGFGQMLNNNSLLDTNGKAAAGFIVDGGRHLLDLVNQLLDLAMVESGKFDLHLETINITDVIHSAIELVSTSAAERNVNIMFEKTNVPEPVAYIDSLKFKQVMLNLLSNAVKYNRQGGKVYLAIDKSGQERIRITVRDTGKGIPHKFHESVFKSFTRVDSAKEFIEGTGIGLSITKEIVEAMNGRIGFSSEPGEGSTFWVEFPTRHTNSIRTNPIISHNDSSFTLKQNVKALYVEDNKANRFLMEQIASNIDGLDLYIAEDGASGLRQIHNLLPDILLVDINLPDMSGHELARVIKADPVTSKITIIAVSADAMKFQIDKTMNQSGFVDYIAKPFSVFDVFSSISKVIDSKLVNEATPDSDT